MREYCTTVCSTPREHVVAGFRLGSAAGPATCMYNSMITIHAVNLMLLEQQEVDAGGEVGCISRRCIGPHGQMSCHSDISSVDIVWAHCMTHSR